GRVPVPAADVRRGVPVEIVVEVAAAQVAAVLLHERGMVVLDAGVDVRHNDVLAFVGERPPDPRRLDPRDVPPDRIDLLRLIYADRRDVERAVGTDRLD